MRLSSRENRRFIIIMAILSAMFVLASFLILRSIGRKDSKSINVAMTDKINSLDPAIAFNNIDLTAISQTYEPLYEYHYLKRPFKVIPLLAQDLPQISNDGLTYTIRIKENIPYHDHPAFNGKRRFVRASDFITQIKRLAYGPMKSNGKWPFEGKIVGFNEFSALTDSNPHAFYKQDIKGLSAPDNRTLVIKLKKRVPLLVYFLTMNFVVPVPVEIVRYYKNDLSKNMIGTGPFKFAEQDDEKLVLTRFKKYRESTYPVNGDRYANQNELLLAAGKKIPFLDMISFKIVNDGARQWKMFQNNNLDILQAPRELITRFISNTPGSSEIDHEKMKIRYFPSLVNRWLAFNMKDKVVGKKMYLIRKAIAHSIDYESYIRKITKNTGLIANSILTPGIPGYDPKHRPNYHYDPKLAKKLLMQAGYPEGEGLPAITYSTRTDQKISIFEGEFIKNQLSKIGIKINVQVLTFKQFLMLGRTGQLQMWTDNWIYDYPDAENIIQLLISQNHPGINKSAYWNHDVDQLYQKLIHTSDSHERLAIIKRIENIVYTDLLWIMPSYGRDYILTNKCIKNFRKSSFIRNYFKYIDLNCR